MLSVMYKTQGKIMALSGILAKAARLQSFGTLLQTIGALAAGDALVLLIFRLLLDEALRHGRSGLGSGPWVELRSP